MKSLRALGPLLILLSSCNYSTMSVDQRVNGVTTRTMYSKYYDDGLWLIPDKLGFALAVDHEKKNVPVLHGAAKFMGALGPSDSVAAGKVTLYLYNFDSKPHVVKFRKLTARGGYLDFEGQALEATSQKRTGVDAGYLQISNFATELDCTVELEVAGRTRTLEMKLPRRKTTELRQLFGPGGTPPYPWGNRSLKSE